MTARHVYGLIVDCDDDAPQVESVLEQMAEKIREAGWKEVVQVKLSIDVPLAIDQRKQDPAVTTPEINLVFL